MVISLVAISEYDQTLFEDESVPRVDEAISVCELHACYQTNHLALTDPPLVLVKSIVTSRWFAESTVMLFCNKIDLFDEKLNRVPLESKYPSFNGRTVGEARQFMADLFLDVVPTDRNVYTHFTCATDTQSLSVVLRSECTTLTLKQNELLS